MIVVLMIGAHFVLISPNRICLDGFQPSEVLQIASEREESLAGDIEGGESHLLRLLASSPLASLP